MNSKAFERKKIEDVSKRVCVGFVGTLNKDYCQKENGVPMYRTTNLTNAGLSNTDLKYVTWEFHRKNLKSQLRKNDLLIARHGDNGKACIYDFEEEANCLNVVIIKPDENKVHPRYLLYKINSPDTKEMMLSLSTGSVQDVINTKAISNLVLDFPPLIIQKRIASILSALDDKIEINRQTNQTFESIAQALFKEWFVDFNFPGFDGTFKNGLPRGWKKKLISDVASNIQYGYTESSTLEVIGPKFLRITDIQGGDITWNNVPYCKISPKDYNKYAIQEHDIFIARTGASTGENIYIVNPPNAVFASYLIRVQFQSVPLACYVGKFLRSNDYFNYISTILSGSAQPNANAKQLTGVEIIIPTDEILDKYFKVVNTLNLKKSNNENENQSLLQLRDILLPKLMNGEISLCEMK